jgi:hypothetical protein
MKVLQIKNYLWGKRIGKNSSPGAKKPEISPHHPKKTETGNVQTIILY